MNDQQFQDYWTWLVDKKHAANATLSHDERVFYAANVLRGCVSGGGLLTYFENTSADDIRDAHHALATLGLSDALQLLQAAQAMILNGRELPAGDTCLSLYDEDLSEEQVEQAMEELDEKVAVVQDKFVEQDDAIFDALCRFAAENALAPQR